MKRDITLGDKYGPAMEIIDAAEAQEYFERCVLHSMTHFGKSREEAEQVERSNLGYCAGYYSEETRRRVERLFSCAHPVFGAIAEHGQPTVEEALEMGKRLGREEAEQHDPFR